MNLAVLRVNHKISGGWGMTIGLGGGAFVLYLGLMFFVIWAAMQGGTRVPPIEPFYYISMILQAGALLIAGPVLLANAIRRDRSRGMLESHRMLPMQSAEVLFGYLGALGPIIVFCLLNAAFLLTIGLDLSVPLLPLLIALAGFIIDALLVWALTLLWSMIHPYLPSLLTLLLIGGTIGSAGVVYLFPTLAPFYLPIFAIKALSAIPIDKIAIPAFGGGVCMLATAALLFLAATRRFRFSHSLGLKPLAATLIFLAAVGATVAGHFLQVAIFDRSFEDRGLSAMATGGTVLLLLVAMLCPIIAAARQNADTSIPPVPLRRIRLRNALLLILAVVSIALPLHIVRPSEWRVSGSMAVLVSLAACAALAAAVAVLNYRARSRLIYLWMFILLLVVVLLPIILLGLTEAILDRGLTEDGVQRMVIQGITAISPAGVTILNNMEKAITPWPSIAVLWGLAGIVWVVVAFGQKAAPKIPLAPPIIAAPRSPALPAPASISAAAPPSV